MSRSTSTSKAAKTDGISASAAKLRLLKKLRCTLKFEKRAWAAGALQVAGVDEVGRGSLFGPVVAAAVILDPAHRIRGLRDSKLLPAERREELALLIREHCIAWAVAAVDSARIDQINIYHASRLAMLRAVQQLAPAAGLSSGGCGATRLRSSSAADHSWRRALCFHRCRFYHCEGRARPHDLCLGSGFSHVRAGFEQGILHAAPLGGTARVRAVATASAVVCAGVERADSAGSLGFYAGRNHS